MFFEDGGFEIAAMKGMDYPFKVMAGCWKRCRRRF